MVVKKLCIVRFLPVGKIGVLAPVNCIIMNTVPPEVYPSERLSYSDDFNKLFFNKWYTFRSFLSFLFEELSPSDKLFLAKFVIHAQVEMILKN